MYILEEQEVAVNFGRYYTFTLLIVESSRCEGIIHVYIVVGYTKFVNTDKLK